MEYRKDEELDSIDKLLFNYYDEQEVVKVPESIINTIENTIKNYLNFQKNKLNFLKKVAILIIIIPIFTTGIVYAGIKVYDIIQKNTATDFYHHLKYDYNEDMLYSNGLYYKRIYNYEDYLEAQTMWDNLVEMSEKDFKKHFLIILAGENYNTTSLYISNIYTDEQKLHIELKQKDVWDENSTIVSAKIPIELNREVVEINNIPNTVDLSEKYGNVREYTEEKALKDGCFVIRNGEIISSNKNQMNQFMDNCNQGIDGILRIFTESILNDENTIIDIVDIESKNGKITMTSYTINSNHEDITYNNTGNKIIKLTRSLTNNDENIHTSYYLVDEWGNKKIICGYEK